MLTGRQVFSFSREAKTISSGVVNVRPNQTVDLIAKKVVDAARNLHGIQEIKPKDPVHTHREFLVPSSNPSNPPYTVSDTDKGWTCTCMDFLIRRRGKGEDCKHITETKALV